MENQFQYQHNLKLKLLRQVLDRLHEEGGRISEDLDEAVSTGLSDLESRQNNLRIADRFGPSGLRVVEQY